MGRHLIEFTVADPAVADRPGQRGRRGLGQMPGERKGGLLGRIGVVECLHLVPALLSLRPEPDRVLQPRVGGEPLVHLDVQQREVVPAHGDPDRSGVGGGRQADDRDLAHPGIGGQRSGPDDAGAVAEDRHRRDRRVQVNALCHGWLLTRDPLSNSETL